MISIIVPVYKAERGISRCIDSIIAQKYKKWELILVDDGSPDNSGEICDEYTKKDTRIKVVHKQNGGASTARNAGLDNAVGEYVLFIDSDDYVDSEHLSNLIAGVQDKETPGVVFEGLISETSDSSIPISFNSNKFTEKTFNRLFMETSFSRMGYSVCKLYKREIIEKHKIRFVHDVNYGEDMLFFINYFQYSRWATFLSTYTYHYVFSDDSQLHANYYSFESEMKCYTHLCDSLDKNAVAHDLQIDKLENVLSWTTQYLTRAMKTMYRPGINYCNRYIRLKNLKICKQNFYLAEALPLHRFANYDRFFLKLLLSDHYLLLDISLSAFFKLRYKLKK